MFMSVINSNFTLVFFGYACHANPGANRKCAGSSRYISRMFLETFQIRLQVIMCLIGHIDHGIHLSYFMSNEFHTLFASMYS